MAGFMFLKSSCTFCACDRLAASTDHGLLIQVQGRGVFNGWRWLSGHKKLKLLGSLSGFCPVNPKKLFTSSSRTYAALRWEMSKKGELAWAYHMFYIGAFKLRYELIKSRLVIKFAMRWVVAWTLRKILRLHTHDCTFKTKFMSFHNKQSRDQQSHLSRWACEAVQRASTSPMLVTDATVRWIVAKWTQRRIFGL